MTADTPRTVHQAVAAVMAELPGIGKGDTSPEGYSYRGIEAVTRHLQPLLAKHGVVIVPKAEVLATVPSPAMKDGWQDVVMRVEWSVYGPDGSHVEATTNGIGRDRSDKGANKAQTQAFKYLLLHLFCIADGKDDADSHSYEGERRPETEPSTTDQVAEFYRLKDKLGADQQAALKAWFRKHRVPPTEKATRQQANDAIETARGLLSRGGLGESGDREAPGSTDDAETGEQAPEPVAQDGTSPSPEPTTEAAT